jgi:hypothetical protein
LLTRIGRAISLAGDELTLAQGKQVFKDSLGIDMPETYDFVGNGIKYVIKEVGTMFTWFKDEGYGADIQALRKEGTLDATLKAIWFYIFTLYFCDLSAKFPLSFSHAP